MSFLAKEGEPRSLGSEALWLRKVEAKRGLPIRIVRDTREYRQILTLPALSGRQNPRPPEIRFDKQGQIYTSRWEPTDIYEIRGRLTIENPKDYRQLRVRGERFVELSDLPKVAAGPRPVTELIFGKVEDSIETAIRQQLHILEGYKPGTKAEELEQVKRVVRFAHVATTRFLSGGLTREKLGSLLEDTSAFLKETGLLSEGIRERHKTKIRTMLLRAAQPDSLDRVNPLITWTRLRSAYLTGLKRAVAISMIIKKAEDNLRLLTWERETTRWALEMAAEDLATLAGLEGKRPPVYFWKKGAPVYTSDIMGMIRVLESIAGRRGLLSTPRVVLYMPAAKLAALNLLGVSAVESRKQAKEIIGNNELVDEILSRSPVPVLLRNKKLAEARTRIRWSHTILISVLNEYASIEEPKTS